MGKRLISIKLDEEVWREAKEIGLNISKVCENALREAIRRLSSFYNGDNDSGEVVGFASQRFWGDERGKNLDLVGDAGLEPATSGSGGGPVWYSVRAWEEFRKKPEWREALRLNFPALLKDFEDFLRIERRAKDLTVYRHTLEIKRFVKFLGFHPLQATKADVRRYLKTLVEKPVFTYANVLKALRVFYRDYLQRGEVVESFKFPPKPFNPPVVPSKEEVRRFYEWLREPLAKAILLFFATTGLRRSEVYRLRIENINFTKRMVIPPNEGSRTKKTWVTFFNEETLEALKAYLGPLENLDPKRRLFLVTETYFRKRCKAFYKETGIKITPQILREFFASEMGRLGVPDRYVDAFCGRVPQSVLARHYTDFNPDRLKEIYDKANLRILS